MNFHPDTVINAEENTPANGFRETGLSKVSHTNMSQTKLDSYMDSTFPMSWQNESLWHKDMRALRPGSAIAVRTTMPRLSFVIVKDRPGGKREFSKSYYYTDQEPGVVWNFILSRPPRERIFYELFEKDMALKLYIDIDDKEKKYSEDEIQAEILTCKVMVKNELERFYPEEYKSVGGINESDWVMLNSSSSEKASYHLILARKFAFQNLNTLSEFMKAAGFIGQRRSRMLKMFDAGVYKPNQSMRLAANTKLEDVVGNKPRYLRMEACPGYTPEQCQEAERNGGKYYPDGIVPEADKHDRAVYKSMLTTSMITDIPRDMIVLEGGNKLYTQTRNKESKAAKGVIDDDPESVAIPFGQDDIIMTCLEAVVEKDPSCVNEYNEWIKVGRLLFSAGCNMKVWVHFSGLGKSPSSESELRDKWTSFGRSEHKKDSEMIFQYIKARVPDTYDKAKNTSIIRMDATASDVSETLNTLYGHQHVFDNGWWYRKDIHWVEDTDKTAIGRTIKDVFVKEVKQHMRSVLEEKKQVKNSGGDEEEIASTCSNLDKRYKILEEVTKICDSGRIGKDWFALEVAFKRPEFTNKLDDRQNILAFDNGVVDLSGEHVLDEHGNPSYEPDIIEDENGKKLKRYDEHNNMVYRPVKVLRSFERREPAEYIDEKGEPRMEFVSKSCGYKYLSKKFIYTEGARTYKKQYVTWLKQWQKFTKDLFPDKKLREYVLNVLATALDGSIDHQNFWVWTGLTKMQQGSNGKSCLKDIILKVFGDYAVTASSELFTSAPAKANEANSAMMALKGSRLAFADEPDCKNGLKIPVIKKMTGGDQISARELHKSQTTFVIHAKIIMLCNEIPLPTQTDDGFWRRFRPVPFPSKFVDEPEDVRYNGIDVKKKDSTIMKKSVDWRLPIMHDLLERLAIYKTPTDEKYCFLNSDGSTKEISGLGGVLKIPDTVKEMIADVKREINFVKDWLDEWLVQDEQGVVKWEELKSRRSQDIRNFFKQDKKLIDAISSIDEGGLGELYGHKHSSTRFRRKEYTVPSDGSKHLGVWGGWRFKTEEEIGEEEGVTGAFSAD